MRSGGFRGWKSLDRGTRAERMRWIVEVRLDDVKHNPLSPQTELPRWTNLRQFVTEELEQNVREATRARE